MPYCQNYYNKGILENNKLLTFLICAKVNRTSEKKIQLEDKKLFTIWTKTILNVYYQTNNTI